MEVICKCYANYTRVLGHHRFWHLVGAGGMSYSQCFHNTEGQPYVCMWGQLARWQLHPCTISSLVSPEMMGLFLRLRSQGPLPWLGSLALGAYAPMLNRTQRHPCQGTKVSSWCSAWNGGSSSRAVRTQSFALEMDPPAPVTPSLWDPLPPERPWAMVTELCSS